MGDTTGIAWTDKTWNPWKGCTKISPGCKNCYMYKEQTRYGSDPSVVTRTKTWRDPYRWNKEAEATGERKLVFTCSWSDVFHDAADEWRPEFWRVIRETPNLTYQILTKRQERIADNLPGDWGASGYSNVWFGVSVENQEYADARIPLLLQTPAAVRFVSVEPLLSGLELRPYLQKTTRRHMSVNVTGALRNKSFNIFEDENGRAIPKARAKAELELLQYKGIRLIPIGTGCDGFDSETGCPGHTNPRIDWVIVGGESGPGARPMYIRWARDLRDQCKAAKVTFFMKQWGSLQPLCDYYEEDDEVREAALYGSHELWSPTRGRWFVGEQGTQQQHDGQPPPDTYVFRRGRKMDRMDDLPEDLRIREFPK